MPKISIDGVEYTLEELSADARQLVANAAAADQEVRHLQVQMLLAQTARSAFVAALKGSLPAK